MIKLSRTVLYALRAVVILAEAKSPIPVPCSRLAAEGELPERFLLQILRTLVNHGILRSTRGVDGGYMLERPASEISVLDVMEALDGHLDTDRIAQQGLPFAATRRLRAVFDQVVEHSRRELGTVTLAQLMNSSDE